MNIHVLKQKLRNHKTYCVIQCIIDTRHEWCEIDYSIRRVINNNSNNIMVNPQ